MLLSTLTLPSAALDSTAERELMSHRAQTRLPSLSPPCRSWVQTLISSGLTLTLHPNLATFQPTLYLSAREAMPHHSRALGHSGAQTLLEALPRSAHAPRPGFKTPPPELSPLSPHFCAPAFPDSLSECSPIRNPIHYSLFSSISTSPPPGKLPTPSPSPEARIMCLQRHVSPSS